MKGDPKVIEFLNKGLRSELTAISQYWLHFRLLNNWGLLELRPTRMSLEDIFLSLTTEESAEPASGADHNG